MVTFLEGKLRFFFAHAVAERLKEGGRGLWLRVPYLVPFRPGFEPEGIIYRKNQLW